MKVYCSGEGCTEFMDVSEAVAAKIQYICSDHVPKITDGPHFQDFAFDPDLGTSQLHHRGIGELRAFVDGDELLFPWNGKNSGFQIKHFRTGYDREVPDWARDNKSLQNLLFTAFPRLHTSPSQRRRAGRWAQVINLYFLKGWSVTEVADELNEDPRVIKRLTLSITRTSKGLTVDGRIRKQ